MRRWCPSEKLVPVLVVARTRVETAAHARRAGKTTFFRHQAMTARTGAGNLAVASLDALPPRRLGRSMQRSSISSLSLSPGRASSVAATTMAADDWSGLWRGKSSRHQPAR
jgi:hypothetical protein